MRARDVPGLLVRESGIRFLARHKRACAVAVVTMGLALGANTLAVAVASAFVTSSFGLPDAERLMVVTPLRELPGRGEVQFAEAYPNYDRLKRWQRSFSDVAAVLVTTSSVETADAVRPVQVARVSASFFGTMEVSPRLGRAFTSDEEGPGADPVAILGHALWRSEFGSDPDVLGRSIRIAGVPHTVVGVMPQEFAHPLPTDLWVPLDLLTPQAWTTILGARNLTVLGRIRPDVEREAVEREMAEITTRAVEADAHNAGFRYSLRSIREFLVPGVDRILAFVRLGSALLVLLAIANVASLLIAWGFERRQEIAVRVALGAGTGRIVTMLVLQGLVVCGLGGVVGVLLAQAALPALRSLDVSSQMALYLAELRLDGGVLGTSALAVAAAGIAAGLIPAWLSRGAGLSGFLRSATRSTSLSPAAVRSQKAMVAFQGALSTVVVCAAVLLGVTFWNLSRVPIGFDPADGAVARIQLAPERYPGAADRADFGARLLSNLAAEPGLTSSGFTSTLPLGDPGNGNRFHLDAEAGVSGAEPLLLHFRRISAGYTEALGIPLIRGRSFDTRDHADSRKVALISSALAARISPDGDPVGHIIYRVFQGGAPEPIEIIGVVGDVPDGGLAAPAGEAVYVHWPQFTVAMMSIVARSSGGAEGALASMRRAVQATDPTMAISRPATLRALVGQANALPRLQTILLTAFAVVALAMVLLGSYGVMTQLVVSREHELSLRLTLGARPAWLAVRVLKESALLALVGGAAGLAGVLSLKSAIEPLVFGIAPDSAPVLTAVTVCLVALAAAAALPAAVRAARLKPGLASRPT